MLTLEKLYIESSGLFTGEDTKASNRRLELSIDQIFLAAQRIKQERDMLLHTLKSLLELYEGKMDCADHGMARLVITSVEKGTPP